MNLYKTSVLLLLTPALTGCVSFVSKQDYEITVASLERRISQIGEEFNITKGAIRENRRSIEMLEAQTQEIAGRMGTMSETINSQTKNMQTNFNKKLDTMMTEVIKENERIIQEINSRRSTSSTSSTGSSTINVYNKDSSKEADLNTGYYHTVEPGESISTIAKRYQVPIEHIVRANGISNPDTLYIGQKLFIPAPE